MNKLKCSLLLLSLCAMLFAGCAYRPEGVTVATGSTSGTEITKTNKTNPDIPNATPEPEKPRFTVSYALDGEVFATETVEQGGLPVSVPTSGDGSSLIRWKNANDTEVNPITVHILEDITFDAVRGPALKLGEPYIAAETDGLFHAYDTFTRSDAVRAVYAILAQKPTGETFLKDVTTKARCYQAASTLVTAGYITLDETGRFYPDKAIELRDLKSMLSHIFASGTLDAVFSGIEEPLTRGEAAKLFNALLGTKPDGEGAFFPDISPKSEYFEAVSAAGIPSGVKWDQEQGFCNIKGYLYCFDEDGYFVQDDMVGTLYFDATGRYTTGRPELDELVAEIVDAQTTDKMTREEMLRAVYVYVRDHYLYLKRNLYEVGETGWELNEAYTMFTTGKGNCYNFTSAFWCLARAVGFDAVCYSGLVGVGRDPHSWTEIEFDGVPYIFDVETEMSYRLQGDTWTTLYKITYETGETWSYAREPYADEA